MSTTPPPGPAFYGVVMPPPPQSERPAPLGQRPTPGAWLVATLALAGLFSFVLPAVSDSLIQTRPVERGEQLGMLGGTLAPPEGWDVSVPGAAWGSLTLTQGDIEVNVFTGVWQGDTDDLIDRLQDWMVGPGVVTTGPEPQPELSTASRVVYRVDIDGADGPGAYLVVREQASVAVIAVMSSNASRWSPAVDRDLEAMVNGLWLGEMPLVYIEDAP